MCVYACCVHGHVYMNCVPLCVYNCELCIGCIRACMCDGCRCLPHNLHGALHWLLLLLWRQGEIRVKCEFPDPPFPPSVVSPVSWQRTGRWILPCSWKSTWMNSRMLSSSWMGVHAVSILRKVRNEVSAGGDRCQDKVFLTRFFSVKMDSGSADSRVHVGVLQKGGVFVPAGAKDTGIPGTKVTVWAPFLWYYFFSPCGRTIHLFSSCFSLYTCMEVSF